MESQSDPAINARTLMARKESIEAEIEVHLSILRSNDCTMKSPLVDAEGFPKADMDIYSVRNARIRVIELRNDLKACMESLGKALEMVYQPGQGQSEPDPELEPFARVEAISPGSPASEAGLEKEDLILKFGSMTLAHCAAGIQPIAKVVADNENKVVVIKVLRNNRPVFLNLSPRKGWGGRGMLGCHVVAT